MPNLARFAATRDARAISDYLAVFAADLDRIERGAHEFETFTPTWRRPFPRYLTTRMTYGHPVTHTEPLVTTVASDAEPNEEWR